MYMGNIEDHIDYLCRNNCLIMPREWNRGTLGTFAPTKFMTELLTGFYNRKKSTNDQEVNQ